MFLFLICLLHLLAMFNGYMIMSSFVLSVQTLEMLLFMYVFFKHGCDLSRMLVVYGINLLNFISGRSMSLNFPNLKQSRKTICAMASNSDVIKPEVFDGASFRAPLGGLSTDGSGSVLQCRGTVLHCAAL